MSELEKSVFDPIYRLISNVIENDLKSSSLSFLEQRKIKSRVENATADFVESLVQFLKHEKISAGQQLELIEICAQDLTPFTENPTKLRELKEGQNVFEYSYHNKNIPQAVGEAGLQDLYSLLFTGVATFLLKISTAVIDWDTTAWSESYRHLDKVVSQVKTLFTPTGETKSAPPTAPIDNLSFDISDFMDGSPAAEEVSFTTLYPREIGVETWNTLLVYAHLTSAIESIRKDSERFKDQITAPKEVTVPSATPLARGTEITIVPHCEGITFNPQRISLAWVEDFHRADFRFRADKSLADDAARGRVDIYVGPLIVGTLKLALLVSETAPQSTEPQEEHGSMYRQDDIFISYSHKDTEVVLGFKKAYEAIGNNVLIDIDELRSGQDWNAELLKMIERAEIFQLFWSESTSQSKYCRQEWEYALKLNKGSGFIRPCYWQIPMPNPPDELSHLHFEYVKL